MKKLFIMVLALSVMSCSSQSRFGAVKIPTSISGHIIKFERNEHKKYKLTIDTKEYGRVEVFEVPDDIFLNDIPVYVNKGKIYYRKP